MNSPRNPRNDWLTPSVVLTLISLAMTAFAAYSTFQGDTDKRLQRLEDRVDLLWGEWLREHGRGQ